MLFWKNKSVLITGGLGMIGSTIAAELVKQGAKVAIIDALLPLYGSNEYNVDKIRNDVEIVIGDIRDEQLMSEMVLGKDVIFNLAAQVSYTDSVTEPLLDLDINCMGQINILDACKKQGCKPLVVFSSSRMVYGKTKGKYIDESHITEPLMPYAIHKLAGEKYHLMYQNNYDIPCIIVRIANPYGPRQQMKHSKYGILNWFIREALAGNEIRVFGDGNQLRDYIYVEDITNAMIKLAENDKSKGEVFNLGSGTGVAFKDMANLVVEVVGNGSVINVPWSDNYSNVETGDYISNIEKLKSYIKWIPKFDLRAGIQKTFDYYSKYKEYYW